MLTWIMALYSVPSAQVKVNDLFSAGFPIKEQHMTEVSSFASSFCSHPRTFAVFYSSECRH